VRRRVHIGSDVFPQQVQAYALVAAAGAGHHAVPLPAVRQLCRTHALTPREIRRIHVRRVYTLLYMPPPCKIRWMYIECIWQGPARYTVHAQRVSRTQEGLHSPYAIYTCSAYLTGRAARTHQ
jgi:hypothetical protein